MRLFTSLFYESLWDLVLVAITKNYIETNVCGRRSTFLKHTEECTRI